MRVVAMLPYPPCSYGTGGQATSGNLSIKTVEKRGADFSSRRGARGKSPIEPGSLRGLRQDWAQHVSGHVRQTEVAAGVAVGELGMIQAQ